MTFQCPQATLPAACGDNKTLRNTMTILLAVLGITLCFTGSIMQLASIAAQQKVPTKDTCAVLGTTPEACSTASFDTSFPCCKKIAPSADTMIWSMNTANTNSPNAGNYLPALSLSMKNSVTFFENLFKNIPDTTTVQNSQGKLFQATKAPFNVMSAGFAGNHIEASQHAFLSNHKKLAEISAGDMKLSALKAVGPTLVASYVNDFNSGIMCLLFTISSLVNMTISTRRGYARANLAFGGAAFAVMLMTYWTTATAFGSFIPMETACSQISKDQVALFNPRSYSADVTGKGALLLDAFPCSDYACHYNDQDNHTCNKQKNPILKYLTDAGIVFLDGQWIWFAGFVISMGVLANIGPHVEEQDEQVMRKNSFAMTSSFQ